MRKKKKKKRKKRKKKKKKKRRRRMRRRRRGEEEVVEEEAAAVVEVEGVVAEVVAGESLVPLAPQPMAALPVLLPQHPANTIGIGGMRLLIPIWAIATIVLVSLFTLAFISALIYYYRRERSKPGPTRHGQAWWNAFTIASLLWIPIKIIRCGTSRAYIKIKPIMGEQSGIASHDVAAPGPRYGDGGNGDAPRGKYEPCNTDDMPPPYPAEGPALPVRSFYVVSITYMREHIKWRH
ncbi:hypothetical protein B0T14DRAFT_490104 [Immersiella caudata]|uniref:Uncharacterized protein n=1 Tax=Immersiella caudata TaxID=314043 RepID=A0AA39XCT4_9PEZI|nr:hypothetical protein B0T14DRAFT_490104 [Immersiella caudata]